MNKLILISLACLLLTGCITAQKPPNNPDPYAALQFDSSVTNGLSNNDRMQYYYMDEGIQYLPVDVLLSLDRPVEDGLGLYDEMILARPERFGLYPNLINRNLIPIGITVSRDSSYVPMAGINCSTCHTSVISYNGKAFLVDGGSGLFAIDRLIKEMVFSIASTVASPGEFGKFYDRYKARTNIVESDKDKKELNALMQTGSYTELSSAVNAHLQGKNRRVQKDIVSYLMVRRTTLSQAYPTSGHLNSGIKMFEYLVKRLLFFAEQGKYAGDPDGSTVSDSGLGRSNPWSVVKNMLAARLIGKDSDDFPKVPGGPINTPNIWGFDQSKWIFWTGVTNSMMERNLAQGVALVTDFNWDTYETTISIKKLHAISTLAKKSNSSYLA